MRLVGRSKIKARLDEVEKKVEQLVEQAGAHFVKTTPIRTGNARRSTKVGNQQIYADYDYAVKLNEGYSSQAPNGMTPSTIEEIQKIVRKL